ncbi:MAG: DUF4271 domain-containing protein [Sphingobacteriales bacterium]|nr:MAG: DUF4271 domain-containing protein [Sphingobacteriales bacterium]
MRQLVRFIFITLFCAIVASGSSYARVDAAKYGVALVADSAASARLVKTKLDSTVSHHPQVAQTNKVVAIQPLRVMNNQTIDFYLMVFMVIMLGVIRYANPRYFQHLWKAFMNPSMTSRQLKDQLDVASFQGLVMNIFFGISAGAYVYYVVRLFMPQASRAVAPSVLLLVLIGGMLAVYLVKYLVMKFSGWAFRLEGITDNYIFNVFLINKIMAVLLIPFSLLLAFGGPELAGPALIVSFLLVAVLLINRYTRSWQVFGSFFQYSRFHFFTYLCASELLPLALLMKLLVRGLNI